MHIEGSIWSTTRICGCGGGIKCHSALVADSSSLFEALADLDGRGIQVEGDSRVSVGMVLNTVQANGI